MKDEFRALSELVTSNPQSLSSSISQISQLSSLPLPSERARQKFLGVGGVPRPKLKSHLSGFFDSCTHHLPPSPFLLLRPNASKNARIARYCSRSCKRDLVQVLATRFLTPLMERMISDWDQPNPFCENCPKWGGGPLRIMEIQ